MKEKEMEIIGKWIAKIVYEVKDHELPEDKQERREYIEKFRKEIEKNKVIKEIEKNVIELCKKFPLYPEI
jgi:glycine/serine hydroxymethyltransferase